ncbi:type II toxin-antitoxin system VapB family antitoxin [Actinomycetota bacterium]
MTANFILSDKLVIEAKKIGNHKTKEEAVSAALKQYIINKRQLKIVKLFGKIKFDEDYDHKIARIR